MSAEHCKGAVKDVMVGFAGPGKLMASGRAAEPTLPPNIGLATSSDQGKTWQPVPRIGEADYHELELLNDQPFGVRTDDLYAIRLDGTREA